MSSPVAAIASPNSLREQPKVLLPKRNFFDLPPEIRNRVYQHFFEDACIKYEEDYEEDQPISTSRRYEILLAAKVCYQEAKVMFYKNASVWMCDPWRKKTTSGMFNANILQYVEEITLRTESGWYCLPEVFKEMKSLKRVRIDHPEDYQCANPEDGVYVKDEELRERFEVVFNPKPAGRISKTVMAQSANKLEITIPVTFLVGGAHAREIYCEITGTGSMRRTGEYKFDFDETKGCSCDICNTRALIWLMTRLLMTAWRRRSS